MDRDSLLLQARARAIVFLDLGINHCQICKSENEEVPCSETGICILTKTPPDDFEYALDAGTDNEFVISCWDEIRKISRTEQVKKTEKSGEKTIEKIYYLPTLEKIEVWMQNQDWKTIPLDRKEMFRRISIFHASYISFLLTR